MFQFAVGIILGLGFRLDKLKSLVFGLRLDYAHGFAVDKQHVVRRADVGLIFRNGHTRSGSQIYVLLVLNDPAAFSQLLVDIVSRYLFRGLIGHAYSNAPSLAKL